MPWPLIVAGPTTGKTTLARRAVQAGVPIIDTDLLIDLAIPEAFDEHWWREKPDEWNAIWVPRVGEWLRAYVDAGCACVTNMWGEAFLQTLPAVNIYVFRDAAGMSAIWTAEREAVDADLAATLEEWARGMIGFLTTAPESVNGLLLTDGEFLSDVVGWDPTTGDWLLTERGEQVRNRTRKQLRAGAEGGEDDPTLTS